MSSSIEGLLGAPALLQVAVGALFLLGAALLLSAGAMAYAWSLRRREQEAGTRAPGYLFTALGTLALTAGLALLFQRVGSGAAIPVPDGAVLARSERGPLRLSWTSNDSPGLLVLAWASTVSFLAAIALRERLFTGGMARSRAGSQDTDRRLQRPSFPVRPSSRARGGRWSCGR